MYTCTWSVQGVQEPRHHFFVRKRVEKKESKRGCSPPCESHFLTWHFYYCRIRTRFSTLGALSSRPSFYSILFRSIPFLRGQNRPPQVGETEPRRIVGKTPSSLPYPTRYNMIRGYIHTVAARTSGFFQVASCPTVERGPSDRLDWFSWPELKRTY